MSFNANSLVLADSTITPNLDLRSAAHSSLLSLYAAAAFNGGIYTSTDMTTWTLQHTTGSSAISNGDMVWFVYGGVFIAKGSGTSLRTSDDGITWTTRTCPGSPPALGFDLVVGDDRVVALPVLGGYVMYSTNGTTWTQGTMPSGDWYDLAYNGETGEFCAVQGGGSYNQVALSADGNTWTYATLAASADIRSITFDGTKLVALDMAGYVHTSADGTTWARSATPLVPAAQFNLVSVNGTIIAARYEDIYASDDSGVTWYLYDNTGGGKGGSFVVGVPTEEKAFSYTQNSLVTITGVDTPPPIVGVGEARFSGISASGTGEISRKASFNLASPMGAAFLAGDKAPVRSVAINAPMQTVTIEGAAKIELTGPMQIVSSSGTGVSVAHIDVTGPMGFAHISGLGGASAYMNLAGPMGSAVVEGAAEIVAQLAGRATLSITGSSGEVAQIVINGPAPLVALTGSVIDYEAIIDITGPAIQPVPSATINVTGPMGSVVIYGATEVTAEYEGYSINLAQGVDRNPTNQYDANVNEVTRYTSYPFKQIVRLKNKYYGVAPDGLYLLDGDTDDGAPIDWAFRTALMDAGKQNFKRVKSVYIGGRLVDAAEVTLVVGEAQDLTYTYVTQRGADAQTYRTKFGKGVRTRYFAFEMAGPDGQFVEVDTVDLESEILERTI